MILQIDVTVTGPDQVLTGSAAVNVDVPLPGLYTDTYVGTYGEDPPPARPAQDSSLLERRRAQMRSQALRGRP